MRSRGVLPTLCVALALGATGCSGHDPATTAPPARVASVDRDFVDAMVPLQQQAVQMSILARTHGAGTEVRALAARIGRSQAGQVTSMRACLDDWEADGRTPMMGGGHMGTDGFPSGMMSDRRMSDLGRRRGTAFDGRFLLMMQQHHRASLRRTATELRDGVDPEARRLARDMQEQMRGELGSMEGMHVR